MEQHGARADRLQSNLVILLFSVVNPCTSQAVPYRIYDIVCP